MTLLQQITPGKVRKFRRSRIWSVPTLLRPWASPIRNQLQLVTLWKGPRTLSIGCVWMASCVDSPQVCGDGAGAALLQGLGVDKPRSLGGSDACLNTSETQCYHDLRRPGSAVRMFMRPFVWAECAQHIHVNVLPGCFQISRANPKRLQLLKRGFVLETHWHHLFGSGVRQKRQFWRTWTPGCSHGAVHVAFTNLLRKLAWIR